MPTSGNSQSQHELYVFHDSAHTAGVTTTRVFFTEDLEPLLMECFIRPSILNAFSRPESLGPIVGHRHYISIRWLHFDVVLGEVTMKELGDEIKSIVDMVLTEAFDWKASVIRPLINYGEVLKVAAKLQVNWSKGQISF